MSHWKNWATKALELPGARETPGLVEALEHIQETGYEPYITLKYEVSRLETEKAKKEREEKT
jgi:hypothetical protein